jgi:hypothetical protein
MSDLAQLDSPKSKPKPPRRNKNERRSTTPKSGRSEITANSALIEQSETNHQSVISPNHYAEDPLGKEEL